MDHCELMTIFSFGHSTELASVRFVNDLIQQMDTFNIPISILIDLSKAFDTLDHKIMLSKLRYYGISGVELNFFRNFLSERIQYVDYLGFSSESLPVTMGVPQGYICILNIACCYFAPPPLISYMSFLYYPM